MKTVPAVRDLALVATLVLSSLASSASAGVIVVNAAGGGQFTSIQAAVNAAVDGDTLLVKSGTYAGFTITDKTLTVVADTSASVQVQGMVLVQLLAVTRSLTLCGLIITGNGGNALVLASNSGEVRIQDCFLYGANGDGYPGNTCPLTGNTEGRAAAFLGASSGGIVFARCVMTGGNAPNALDWCCCDDGKPGGIGLDVSNCRVALFDCLVFGGRGGNQGCLGGSGGHGCRVQTQGSGGYAGISISGSTLHGGDGGIGNNFQCGGGGAGGHGLVLLAGTQAWLLHDTLQGGSGGTGYGAPGTGLYGAAISGPGVHVDFGVSTHLMLQMPSVARESTIIPLTFIGPAGSSMWLMKSSSSPFLPMPGWRGVLLTDTNRWDFQWLGRMPAGSSQYQINYFVPTLPAGVDAERRYFQTFLVDPNGNVQLGNLSVLTILDSAY